MSFAFAKPCQWVERFSVIQPLIFEQEMKQHRLWIDKRCHLWVSCHNLVIHRMTVVDAKKLEQIGRHSDPSRNVPK